MCPHERDALEMGKRIRIEMKDIGYYDYADFIKGHEPEDIPGPEFLYEVEVEFSVYYPYGDGENYEVSEYPASATLTVAADSEDDARREAGEWYPDICYGHSDPTIVKVEKIDENFGDESAGVFEFELHLPPYCED